MDLSCLDTLGVLEIIFPLAYSPLYTSEYFQAAPATQSSLFIEVEKSIQIGVEFWSVDKAATTILFFHGNGETAADYEYTSSLYNACGINLFFADYRGYGASGGKPTVSNMLSDSFTVFLGVRDFLQKEGFSQTLFVMGRSLGSMPAIELAYHYADEIRGLIIESGSANNFRRLCQNLKVNIDRKLFDQDSLFLNKVKIGQIKKPTLIIHSEMDELVPLEEGKELFACSGSPQKRFLIISGAGHNNIMMVDEELYFGAIQKFILASS